MRLFRLILADIRFQYKYGFYALYAIFTLLYVLIGFAVPGTIRTETAAVLIFTDPAVLGMFFMGAIVLLEKSQRVNCALAVSPIRIWEYVASKLLSLCCVSLCAGLILALLGGIRPLLLCAVGTMLGSCLFSACGLIVAMYVSTLNQYLLFIVPFELVLCLPPIVLFFGFSHPALLAHPGIAAASLIYGKTAHPLLCIASLLVWGVPAFWAAVRAVRRNFADMGGVRL